MIRKIFNDESQIIPYVARMPEKMKPKLPLIVLLHGAGERGDGSDSQILKAEKLGFSHLFTENVDIECILVQPQCKEGTFWVADIQGLRRFVEKVIKDFDADENRIYLTGISMGGYGAWYFAEAYPNLFAALMPVCGGGMPWNAGGLNMPIWAWHGACDTVVKPTGTTDMIEALESSGKKPKCNIVEGVGHNVWDYAYNEETLQWLLSQKKA